MQINDVSILTQRKQPESDFSLCEVGYEKCRPTKKIEFIPIDYWVLHYVTAGQGYFGTPSFPTTKLTAGDFFIIPANCRNRYYPDPKDPWSYRWIGFSGKVASKYLAQVGLNKENCIIRNAFDSKIEHQFYQVYCDFRDQNTFALLSGAFSIFNSLAHLHQEKVAASQPEWLFNEIIAYINTHLNERITVDELALKYNIDRTYIYKLFKRYHKLSPSTYIQQIKLQQACSLLRKSSLSITEISYELGFASSAYFSKFFYKWMQCTPTDYRSRFIVER